MPPPYERAAEPVHGVLDRQAARTENPLGPLERHRIPQRILVEHWTSADHGARAMALAFATEGTIAAVGDAVYRPLFDLIIGIVAEGQASGEPTTPLPPGSS
ncbi:MULTISPECIES: hypothetical protein [Thermomonospora]|nr:MULTISPECIES: hypothetical protein [Thermomonospora]